MRLEGFEALKFLATHANKENQIVGESLDVEFRHPEFVLTYGYFECVIFEMKYNNILMKNYVNLVIVKELFNDRLPLIVPTSLYKMSMAFKTRKKGRIFKIKSKDLRDEETAKLKIEDGKMYISLEMSDLVLDFEPTGKEQKSLLKGRF